MTLGMNDVIESQSPSANEQSPGRNTKSFMIDGISLVANGDATLTINAIDKSSELPKNREVRLLLEVRNILLAS